MMMQKYEIHKLRSLPIEGVAQRLGFTVKHHKALCPFHNDHTPSMTFKKNKFRCWSCGESGDSISFVMKVLGKDFLDACRWLGGESAQRGRFSLCTKGTVLFVYFYTKRTVPGMRV